MAGAETQVTLAPGVWAALFDSHAMGDGAHYDSTRALIAETAATFDRK
jgi:hypothetical protein